MPKTSHRGLAAFLRGKTIWVLGLIGAFVTWYFHDCYDDRKKAIPDLKDAFVSMRAADEQAVQTSVAATRETYALINYLEHGAINTQQAQVHLSSVIAAYDSAYTSCAKSNEALGRYMNALKNMTELFEIQEDDQRQLTLTELSYSCSMWKEWAGAARSVEPAKLVDDPIFRQRFVTSFEKQRAKADALDPQLNSSFLSDYTRIEAAIDGVEARRFSLSQTCWDCARRLVHSLRPER